MLGMHVLLMGWNCTKSTRLYHGQNLFPMCSGASEWANERMSAAGKQMAQFSTSRLLSHFTQCLHLSLFWVPLLILSSPWVCLSLRLSFSIFNFQCLSDYFTFQRLNVFFMSAFVFQCLSICEKNGRKWWKRIRKAIWKRESSRPFPELIHIISIPSEKRPSLFEYQFDRVVAYL